MSTAEPGDPITLTTTATPGSVVLLSVFDKSLSLLAEACKSLENDNVKIKIRISECKCITDQLKLKFASVVH